MRSLLIFSLVCMPMAAYAHDGFSPLSGPNTAIPSPVCDVINFGFCPQPAQPTGLDLPDPNEVAPEPRPLPPPPTHHHGARRHHHPRAY